MLDIVITPVANGATMGKIIGLYIQERNSI